MSDVEYNNKNLKKLLKAFKQVPNARVGVLADSGKNPREDGSKTNAEVGAKHEFGLDGMPIRSFLRMPISQNLQQYLENSGAFDKETIDEVIASGSLHAWIQKVGVVGERIVLDAFATGGFGQWKPSNMKYKKVQQTLVESQQLRNSITSDVEDAS